MNFCTKHAQKTVICNIYEKGVTINFRREKNNLFINAPEKYSLKLNEI